jgi:predicted amidohydrolase YtcJ
MAIEYRYEKTRMKNWFVVLLGTLLLVGCGQDEAAPSGEAESPEKIAADTIYSGGPILTMDDAQPTAEAVAVKDGRILFVGSLDEAKAFEGEGTESFSLDGRTMVPGFVDSHGHVVMGGLQALSANLLAPPDGDVTDIASLQATLSAWA